MYCVKCGVRLQDGVSVCPLCQTPVWNPDESKKEELYPDNLPHHTRESGLAGAAAMTVVCVIALAAVMIVCFRLYGALRWGSYAVGGILLFYIAVILPGWFRRPRSEVFVPVDFVAAALYALLICLQTGGSWFFSFALPVLLLSCLLTMAMICLLKYVRRGKYYIFGGFLILLGGFTVLVELFEHLTFGTAMFRWSLFSLAVFGVVGLFLLLSGMIRPLRHALEKHFFF